MHEPTIVDKYLETWERLQLNPDAKTSKALNEASTPIPVQLHPKTWSVVFSPRKSLHLLELLCSLIQHAKNIICVTSAFGLHASFVESIEHCSAMQRFILLEKKMNADTLSHDPRNRIAVGTHFTNGKVAKSGKMMREPEVLSGLNMHVKYVHLKLLLIDPLGDDPISVFGSGNFSTVSNTRYMILHKLNAESNWTMYRTLSSRMMKMW
jgi:phosphatidylserine/phosphatidylglycerophosphate/cardiolipin synthase-like enzyme